MRGDEDGRGESGESGGKWGKGKKEIKGGRGTEKSTDRKGGGTAQWTPRNRDMAGQSMVQGYRYQAAESQIYFYCSFSFYLVLHFINSFE
jgi:hypothetical protein